jgi:hypothetical protein
MPDLVSDQRRSLPGRHLLQARCIFNNGNSSLDVMLRDLSASGARIVGAGLFSVQQRPVTRVQTEYAK